MLTFSKSLTSLALKKPKQFFYVTVVVALLLIFGAALPSFNDTAAKYMNALTIDTDPENMLSYDEPVKQLHRDQKALFGLSDMVVVGVVEPSHKNGVFNRATLAEIQDLTLFAKEMQWTNKEGEQAGVIAADLMSPSTLENISQESAGAIRFDWLMSTVPKTESDALLIRDNAKNLPLLNGTLVSDDGKSIALYLPITSKDVSYNVAKKLEERIATYKGAADYHITGMPVAQDVFGVEMFKQMVISAPAAMLLIYLIMWYFFKKAVFVISPMIVALVSVIITMGTLIISGNVIHIMSSMIPIFIMPIAVLDGVHILSDFYEHYPQFKNRRETLNHVMADLNKPMLFTTLTTAVGFGSLALTPIPPVQVFGVFVALGVILAWFFTITLIPAYIMLMPESALAIKADDVAAGASKKVAELDNGIMSKMLRKTGHYTFAFAKPILVVLLLICVSVGYGISEIVINDNPVKWFAKDHPIRVADDTLNERFAGTYMAYLSLSKKHSKPEQLLFMQQLKHKLMTSNSKVQHQLASKIDLNKVESATQVLQGLMLYVQKALDVQDDETSVDFNEEVLEQWEQVEALLEALSQKQQYFKDPEVLNYIADLQAYLLTTGQVGKSNSLADVVKTVHREVFSGKQQDFVIPKTAAAVAQILLTYQNSHRPQDLWHFVTPDYQNTSLWLQLKSGDNTDMSLLVDKMATYFAAHPAPHGLSYEWFGLTYINVVWQDKMVGGMAEAFIGSFILVFLMMALLFRSILWGMLAMIPLAFTITVIYGLIGLIGKDYDMPVAVLSSLSLGLAVDYAIHFISRSRETFAIYHDWKKSASVIFEEPARAITRNVIVVGVGFMPLLAAPLIPYQTVGVFISAILLLAGIATLVILPALIRLLSPYLFKTKVDYSKKNGQAVTQ